MTKDEALAGEPVTWGVDWSNVGDIPCVSIIKRLPDGGIEVLAVEYGPPRPWVGLTEVDILAASRHWRHAEDFMAGVDWAAGTLKEKNT